MAKYIYIYIYILYVYVSNQIQQNKMQPEHVSEAERFNILLCVCALRSVAHAQSKRSANDPLTLTGQGRNHGIDIGGVQMWALPQIFFFKFSRGSDCKNKQARPSTNE